MKMEDGTNTHKQIPTPNISTLFNNKCLITHNFTVFNRLSLFLANLRIFHSQSMYNGTWHNATIFNSVIASSWIHTNEVIFEEWSRTSSIRRITSDLRSLFSTSRYWKSSPAILWQPQFKYQLSKCSFRIECILQLTERCWAVKVLINGILLHFWDFNQSIFKCFLNEREQHTKNVNETTIIIQQTIQTIGHNWYRWRVKWEYDEWSGVERATKMPKLNEKNTVWIKAMTTFCWIEKLPRNWDQWTVIFRFCGANCTVFKEFSGFKTLKSWIGSFWNAFAFN